MKPSSLIGKRVDITDRDSMYYGHWGIVQHWDGETYHVGGGSISVTGNGACPIFDRNQFKVRKTNLDQGVIGNGRF